MKIKWPIAKGEKGEPGAYGPPGPPGMLARGAKGEKGEPSMALTKEYIDIMQGDPGPNPYSEEYTIILRRVQEVKEMVQKLDEEVSSMHIRLDIIEQKLKKEDN